MRFFFWHNDDYISLPDQEALFSLPFALVGHIEKRSFTAFGWRWRKRAVVLNPTGHLIIYKYFLEGIGAGKPFVGRIIHLDAAEHIQARMDHDVCYIKIHDHARRRTELRVKGTKARLWAAKVFMYEAPLNDCQKRSTGAEIDWPIEKRPLKILDSRISTSSIHDIDTAAKAKYSLDASRATVASISSESVPDYTTSDGSCQNNQLAPAKILICGRSDADENTETNYRPKRSQSASEFTTTVEFSTAQEATRSLSLDQLDTMLASRRDRFRKHLKSMIESRLYESLTECSLNYSVTSIQQLRAQAGNLRMSQFYVPYSNNNTLRIKDGVAQRQKLAQFPGPSAPLSTDLSCKFSEKTDGSSSNSQTDVVYRF